MSYKTWLWKWRWCQERRLQRRWWWLLIGSWCQCLPRELASPSQDSLLLTRLPAFVWKIIISIWSGSPTWLSNQSLINVQCSPLQMTDCCLLRLIDGWWKCQLKSCLRCHWCWGRCCGKTWLIAWQLHLDKSIALRELHSYSSGAEYPYLQGCISCGMCS